MMLEPDALRARLRTSWTRNRQAWLAGEGQWPFAFSIGLPTQAQAVANWSGFDAWLRAWREFRGGGEVEYVDRLWPKLGAQRLPQRWSFDSPQTVADSLGEGDRWCRAMRRHGQWLGRFVDGAGVGSGLPMLSSEAERQAARLRCSTVLARSFDLLADLDDRDFARLSDVLAWLLGNPASRLYLRQLPIAGIDSKWIEPYRGVLVGWLCALRGAEPISGFDAVAGLRAMPDRIRMRLLDPVLRTVAGGLDDIEAPTASIERLALPVRCVFIVENLATGMAFEDLPGAVVFMARGYAVEAFDEVQWLRGLPVAYWGDIDTHGLAILDRLRSRLPQVQSLMMDETTLLRFRELWVDETRQARPSSLPRLLPQESNLYAGLIAGIHGPRIRLEQERIPWNWAWSNVRDWAVATLADGVRVDPP